MHGTDLIVNVFIHVGFILIFFDLVIFNQNVIAHSFEEDDRLPFGNVSRSSPIIQFKPRPFTIDCKLALIFERSTYISKSNQLMNRKDPVSCIILQDTEFSEMSVCHSIQSAYSTFNQKFKNDQFSCFIFDRF